MVKAFKVGSMSADGSAIEKFMNGDLVVKGVTPRRIESHTTQIDVTTFSDSSPKFINGQVTHTVELRCTQQGLAALVSHLTGTTVEQADVSPEIIAEAARKVKVLP